MVTDLSHYNRLFFLGDLHGEWDKLMFAYDQLGINDKDGIILVGDYIDRGAKSIETLTYAMFTENVYAVRGNHEDMMIRALRNRNGNDAACWIANGGGWALDYPQPMLEGLAYQCLLKLPFTLTINYRGTTFGVCHGASPCEEWDDISILCETDSTILQKAMWDRQAINGKGFDNIKGIDYTIHGHSVRPQPTVVGNQHWIDTGSVFDTGSGKYGLTIMEWDGKMFTTHRVQVDPYEPKGLKLI